MAETGAQGGDQGGAQGGTQGGDQPQLPQVKLLAHYVRDLSFENVAVLQGHSVKGQPEIQISVHLDGGHMGESNYQLNMKINAKAVAEEQTRFLVELDYGGVFSIQNAPESHLHAILFVECPRLLWPFARRVVADVTRDGGYPSLMLDNIDFAQLYRQRIEEMRRRQEAEGKQPQGQQAEASAEAAGGEAAEPGARPGADGPDGQKPH